jgi:hypothetical protein
MRNCVLAFYYHPTKSVSAIHDGALKYILFLYSVSRELHPRLCFPHIIGTMYGSADVTSNYSVENVCSCGAPISTTIRHLIRSIKLACISCPKVIE